MIIAEQMKQAVDKKKVDLPADRVACRRGLAHGFWNGDNNVAEEVGLDMGKFPLLKGEGQHVRTLVLSAVLSIKGTHCAVADKEYA
jgi:hypothetical protein